MADFAVCTCGCLCSQEQREALAARRAAIEQQMDQLHAARAAQAAAADADAGRCDDPAAPACAAQEMLELTLAVQVECTHTNKHAGVRTC